MYLSISIYSSCNQYRSLADLPTDYLPGYLASKNYDAFITFAQAMHNLRTLNCPTATGQLVRQCLTQNDLYSFIMNVTANGTGDVIKFDGQANVLTSYYVINQYRRRGNKDQTIQIGKWFRQNASLIINMSLIDWNRFQNEVQENLSVISRFVMISNITISYNQ